MTTLTEKSLVLCHTRLQLLTNNTKGLLTWYHPLAFQSLGNILYSNTSFVQTS